MINVLMIGVGYFPYLTSGEKNYFYRLCPLFNDEVGVSFFSLNDYEVDLIYQETPTGKIPVYCARRPFHRNYDRFFFRANNYISYHHKHKPQQEIAEKLISIVAHLPRLRKIIRNNNIHVIHFMDNFGFGMPFLKVIFPKIKITYSAANYDPRQNQALYDNYLRMSIGYLDGAGVYTDAYRKILEDIGVKIPLTITRWGVHVDSDNILDQSKKIEVKKSLGIESFQKLLLWSGYIQQVQEDDFYKTIDIANRLAEANKEITFIFAFKPETYKQLFSQKQSKGVRVLSGIENFGELLASADLFLSPIGSNKSTISPPLTWLEAMSKGTPVLTTNVGGVDEVISHNINGFIADDYDRVADTILEAVKRPDLDQIATMAVEKVKNKFNIINSSKQLTEFWKEICI